MKSINNKAVKNMVLAELEIMMSADTTEALKDNYDSLQDSIKRYYETCKAIAEYNELLARFAGPSGSELEVLQ